MSSIDGLLVLWSSPEFLNLCESLGRCGIHPTWRPGDRVARGFADLGYEEFLVLPGDKLLSLISGTLAACSVEGRAHFFPVPTVDELVQSLVRAGVDVETLSFEEQRQWILSTAGPDGSVVSTSTGAEIGIALARRLLQLQKVGER